MSIQKGLDQRRHQIRSFNVKHMSRALVPGTFNVRKYRAKCLGGAVGTKLGRVIRLLAHQHQQWRAQLTPARLGIFPLVQYRIPPVMAWIARKPYPTATIEFTPGRGDKRGLRRRQSRGAKSDDAGPSFESRAV